MQLDRNRNSNGMGKYALVLLRRTGPLEKTKLQGHHDLYYVLNDRCVDLGDKPETEFFVLRLKDKHAAAALYAYAESIEAEDPEFSLQVRDLAVKSEEHPNRQAPD